MQLTLYSNFSKRRNSTKRPTGSGTVYDVRLKDGCSVEAPVFLIDGIDLNVDYAYWDGRYYFIDDIILSNARIYELHCSIDVLATYKNTIGAATLFIARAASDFDPMLPDELLSNQQDIVNTRQAITYFSGIGSGDVPGCFLVNVMSKSGVRIYGYDHLSDIIGICDNNAMGLTDNQLANLVQTLGLNLIDVSSYVSNVRWVPYSLSSLAGYVETVKAGMWELRQQSTGTSIDAKYISQTTIYETGILNKPINIYDDFRANHNRFSTYTLYLPGVGLVPLSPIENSVLLGYYMCLDLISGNVQYLIYERDENNVTQRILGEYDGQMGVEVPYATISHDAWGVMQSVLAPSIGGGGYAGLATGVARETLDVCKAALDPQVSLISAAGNISILKSRCYIMLGVANYGSKEYLTAAAGRPLCEWRQINTLSGYIKCSGAALEIAGTAGERDDLNNHLNSGFYYE